MASSGGALQWPVCRGKVLGSANPRPLGAGMGSSASRAFTAGTRLTQRGHGLRPRARASAAALGSNMAIMAPSGAPLETGVLQGKIPQGPGSAPFGGSNGLVPLRANGQVVAWDHSQRYCDCWSITSTLIRCRLSPMRKPRLFSTAMR
jgi:hypothetical protein